MRPTARQWRWPRIITLATLVTFAAVFATVSDAIAAVCTTPVEVVTLIDLTIGSVAEFRRAQSRLIDGLRQASRESPAFETDRQGRSHCRRIEMASRGRTSSYALIVWHRQPVPLSGLNTPLSRRLDRMIQQLAVLTRRQMLVGGSRTHALERASEQIRLAGTPGASTLILIADGAEARAAENEAAVMSASCSLRG